MNYRCPHHNVRIVWTWYSSYGDRYTARQLRHQCVSCGELVGAALKHALASSNTPELSRDEAMRAYRTRQAHWERQREQRDREFQTARARRRREYQEYLQSNAWAERHTLVIERAGGICEGCRKAAAEQVHHITYEHVGNEFLWELVAICRTCHGRAHNISQDDF
jgi:5-methylcytosine-specific restriction endonuclease McrA